MGKGDRKTAKGKRNIASYGNARPHNVLAKAVVTTTKAAAPAKAAVKKAPAKKAPAKKASA